MKITSKGKRTISERDHRIDSLETTVKSLDERLDKCEVMKEQQAQFIFQSVSMTVGLFAVILVILIGFSTNWDFDRNGEGLAVALLGYIAGIVTIWLFQSRSRSISESRLKKKDS